MTNNSVQSAVQVVTERICERSAVTRAAYLARVAAAASAQPVRKQLSCTNLAHAFAASDSATKQQLSQMRWPNIAIISAYNDMLSAHQPLVDYPEIIKSAARNAGAVAQFAGGVPAMCDGITQGQPGMELSLFSRDIIAQATAIALSHNCFDAAVCLGVCDKIVPGLLIGALSFGHLPFVFIPAGPMPSGLPNGEKGRIRQQFAAGEISRDQLLEAEMKSYHTAGTCTFYGTANSNQLLVELMGLHLPGSAFVNPNTPLRTALTGAAAEHAAGITNLGDQYRPIGQILSEKALVNAIVGLLATGGSTNHTMHLVAVARAAGIIINWDDFNDLSACVPLLTRIYPNGDADVNQFHAAGGLGLVTRQLLELGLLHNDVLTIMGDGLEHYTQEPFLENSQLRWRAAPTASLDPQIIAAPGKVFAADGGIKLLTGNLGRAVIKTSAIAQQHFHVEAPARVFDSQQQALDAMQAGELTADTVVVVRFQGPAACGMPELHKLTPNLGLLQDSGLRVALVTDGRMSGASGKVPAAIHVTPESSVAGPLARVRDGDIIVLDCAAGTLEALVDPVEWQGRTVAKCGHSSETGMGRELFSGFRAAVGTAETGALACGDFAAGQPVATLEALV